ncbi:MAG: helix-turn-helix domain-containing protein [Roseburia hominis]
MIDDILYYIEHNYARNLTLEAIAPLFGYNSSYLGKIFSKKVGENFNSYLDHVRIEHSKELLLGNDMKVYEIAEKSATATSIIFTSNSNVVGMTLRRIPHGTHRQ